jgi:hypothetical protein
VSFTTAALGGEIEVPTLAGKAAIDIPEGTQAGKQFRLRGKGIKGVRSSYPGDLYCHVVGRDARQAHRAPAQAAEGAGRVAEKRRRQAFAQRRELDRPAEELLQRRLFQGYKQLRLRNWHPCRWCPPDRRRGPDPRPPGPQRLPAPAGARRLHHGRVHATAGTRDLCAILLPDSGHMQEEDAAFANRHGSRSTHPRCRCTPAAMRCTASSSSGSTRSLSTDL